MRWLLHIGYWITPGTDATWTPVKCMDTNKIVRLFTLRVGV